MQIQEEGLREVPELRDHETEISKTWRMARVRRVLPNVQGKKNVRNSLRGGLANNNMISLNADNLETLCRACHAIAHGVKPPLAEGLAFDEYGNVVESPLMPKPAEDDDEFY